MRVRQGLGCCSSVVEHSLGKGEVESSILSNSTIRRTGYPLETFVIVVWIGSVIRLAGRVNIL